MTLVYLAAAWIAGIALAGAVHPPWQLLPLVGLVSILVLLLWRDERRVQMAALSVLFLTLGAGRLLLAVPRFDDRSLSVHNDVGWVTLEGVVVSEPDERDDYTTLRVRARRLILPNGTEREVRGLALVQTQRYPRRAYGDRLRITGLLQDPPVYEGFSYRDYLARQGIHSFMRYARTEVLIEGRARAVPASLFAFKGRVHAIIVEMLPEPQAALLSGILLGVESGIPDEVMADFEATGTSHIIVISGFNITIIAAMFAGMAGRLLHRRRAILVAMAAVGVYTILVGASAAVVRAALMGFLYLFGRYVGRRSYAPVSLAAAALVMTAWNPHTLWDRGFLLSFAATAGLLLYAEPLEHWLEGSLARITSARRARRMVGLVSDGLLVTIAAQLTTLPLIMHAFGRLSLVTLLTNTLILPAQPYVMTVGGAALLLGMIVRPVGRLVGWVAWVFLTYTLEAVRLTAQIPRASVPIRMEGWMVWAYYALLGGLTWWLATPRERRRGVFDKLSTGLWSEVRDWLSSRREPKLLLGSTAILLVLALAAWRALPDGRLHVHVLDVGQGDAIFVETPSGRQVLMDGGPSPSVLLSQLGRHMPFWDRTLDLIVLTHPDGDHITGLVAALERYEVEAVVWREMGCPDPVCERWRELLAKEGATVYRGEAGLGIALDKGLRMEVLHPGAELLAAEGFNDNSLVARLSYGEVSILFAGDIEGRAEEGLLAEGAELGSTVLKVAHHGGCGSSTEAFLEAVGPEAAVISVGQENDFGHPCDEVLERLEAVLGGNEWERRLFRTDWDGTVELVSDGLRLWIETGRARSP